MHIQFVENIKKVGDYVLNDLKHNDRKREVHNLHAWLNLLVFFMMLLI